jgi:selenocysteine lyase/cysteine desulfurase
LGKALVLLQRIGLDLIQQDEQALTARALRGLAQIAGVEVYGIKDPGSARFACKGGVIVFGLKGLMPGQVARALAEQGGIGVRYGCHCAHMLVKHLLGVSLLLEKFQRLMLLVFPQLSLPGLTRVSLGIENNAQDVDTLLNVLRKIARQPHPRMDNPFASTKKGAPALPQTEIQRQMNDFTKAAAAKVYAQC